MSTLTQYLLDHIDCNKNYDPIPAADDHSEDRATFTCTNESCTKNQKNLHIVVNMETIQELLDYMVNHRTSDFKCTSPNLQQLGNSLRLIMFSATLDLANIAKQLPDK